MKRRLTRILFLLLAALPLSGCVWMQNEFFVYERVAPPALDVPGGELPTAPW